MYILNLSQNVYININLIICIFRNGNSKTYPPVIGGLCLFIFAILAYLILLLTQRPI